MRKLVVTLLSSLAIALPQMGASPVQANSFEELSFADGMTKAWQHFSNYESSKALAILNHLNQRSNLSAAESELLSLIRLTIYRQYGNNLVDGLPNDAIKYLTEAIVIDDSSAHARRRRGLAYCEIGNFDACKQDYAVAWNLTKDKSSEMLASHLSERGIAYQEAGRIQEGNADFREAARLYRLLGEERRAKSNEFLIRPE